MSFKSKVQPNQTRISMMMMMVVVMIMVMMTKQKKYLNRILFTAWVFRIVSVPSCIDFFQSSDSLKQIVIIQYMWIYTIKEHHEHFGINYEQITTAKTSCKHRITYMKVRSEDEALFGMYHTLFMDTQSSKFQVMGRTKGGGQQYICTNGRYDKVPHVTSSLEQMSLHNSKNYVPLHMMYSGQV
jgi:hypothetical protein